MKLDLHLHSHVSDGRLAPADVVAAALAGGLDVIALTDHDTTAGVAAARAAAAGTRLAVVPGIEISTRHGEHDLHILGYWVDPEHRAMVEYQEVAKQRRADRMRRMVDRLQRLGVRVEFDDVVRAAGPGTRVLGRPHLARALLAAGEVRYFGEAFERYLRDGGPAFVLEAFPSVAEAIELIHRSGGLAVWAHPPLPMFEREIRGFAELGLDGVECIRPGMLPMDVQLMEGTADTLGLLVTGGSDWHGPGQSLVGDFFLRPHEVRGFLEARQSASLLARPGRIEATPPQRG